MKTSRRLFIGIFLSIFFIACQKDHRELTTTQIPAEENSFGKGSPGDCNPLAYAITLESKEFDGTNWVWTWSIENLNPGNGNDGTAQDLSNWGMQFGSCFTFTSVVGASYSGDGINWTTFTPSLASDPSQTCINTAVLKFDFGTTDVARSYYRLVISTDYPPGTATGYIKSGSGTGCCNVSFIGIGCTGGPTEERSGK
jgi:hypothetical protein